MKAAEKIVEPETQLVPYSLENAVVESLKTKYMDITIKPDDKAAYKMVMGGLKECREIRLAVDGWHKDKKEWILKAGKHYDSERRRVHALVEPVETHLKTVREAEDNRKVKIEQDRVNGIRAKITAIQIVPGALIGKTLAELNAMWAKVFDAEITEAEYMEFATEALNVKANVQDALITAIEAREKFDKEEAERKAEAARLEAQRKEQEAEAARLTAERKAQEEAAAKVRAEQEAEAKRLEDLRKAEEEKVRKEREALEAEKRKLQEEKDRTEFEKKANERAEAEAKAKLEAEAKAKAEKEAWEKAEKERLEMLKPNKEKILAFLDEIAAVKMPVVDGSFDELLQGIGKEIRKVLKKARKDVEAL